LHCQFGLTSETPQEPYADHAATPSRVSNSLRVSRNCCETY
jgi:hypothetical protein